MQLPVSLHPAEEDAVLQLFVPLLRHVAQPHNRRTPPLQKASVSHLPSFTVPHRQLVVIAKNPRQSVRWVRSRWANEFAVDLTTFDAVVRQRVAHAGAVRLVAVATMFLAEWAAFVDLPYPAARVLKDDSTTAGP